jgi:hypothetical protein
VLLVFLIFVLFNYVSFRIKRCSVRLYLQLFVGGSMYHLYYLHLLAYCDLPTHIVMCFCFVLFAFVLCLVVHSVAGISWLSVLFHWNHYFNGFHIRRLNGSDFGNYSILSLQFCDYQDAGEYICSVTLNGRFHSVGSMLSIHGMLCSKHDRNTSYI